MSHRQMMQSFIVLLTLAILVCLPSDLPAYSVLSHETLIDAAWESGIRPILRKRFPDATPEDLLNGHAFAYGGSLIQDLGYYPRGSHEYSDLVHYVRSGDFILALLHDARDVCEYAFALGALAHYSADMEGHRMAVNRAVPVLYPHLREKYGKVVTYEDDPVAHAKTEFGFDVLEVAKQRFAPEGYRKLIGFKISKELLQRAFEETYSIPLESKFPNLDSAIGSFRYTVHSLIPKAVEVAWELKQKEIRQDIPGITRGRFLYNLSRASYESEWGKDYQKPGCGTKILAFVIRLLPKIGPLRVLSLRTPTPEAEQMFQASFNAALQHYQDLLRSLREGKVSLPNRNLDTGGVTARGTYFMSDGAYARLLDQLVLQEFEQISPELRTDILAHFADAPSKSPIKRDRLDKTKVDWSRIPQQLQMLRDHPGTRTGEKARPREDRASSPRSSRRSRDNRRAGAGG